MLCYIHRMSSGGWGTNYRKPSAHYFRRSYYEKNCSAYPSCPVPGCFALLLAGCSGGGDASEGGDSAGSVTLKIWVQSTNQPEYFQWVKGGI